MMPYLVTSILHHHKDLIYCNDDKKAYVRHWRFQGDFSDIDFLLSLSEAELYRLIHYEGRADQTGYYGEDLQAFMSLEHSPFNPASSVFATIVTDPSPPLTTDDIDARQAAYTRYRKGKSSETESDLITFFGIVRDAILSVDTEFLDSFPDQDLFRLLLVMRNHLHDCRLFQCTGNLSDDLEVYKSFLLSHTQPAVAAVNLQWQPVADHLRRRPLRDWFPQRISIHLEIKRVQTIRGLANLITREPW